MLLMLSVLRDHKQASSYLFILNQVYPAITSTKLKCKKEYTSMLKASLKVHVPQKYQYLIIIIDGMLWKRTPKAEKKEC